MALFSRRPKKTSDDAVETAVDAEPAVADVQQDVNAAVAAEEADAEDVPHVPISVSTYGQPARRPAPAPTPAAPLPQAAETAPERTEGRAGVPDNTLLMRELAALPETPDNAAVLGVMRQALQGNLYLRILGDARAQMTAGEPLRLAISILNDKKFLLAYTGTAAVEAGVAEETDSQTSVLGQPANRVLQNAIDAGYDGVMLDHAGPGRRIVLPVGLITQSLSQADPDFTIKNLLSDARTDATARYVVEAIVKGRSWIAAGTRTDGEGMGIAEARSAEGTRYLQVFSHPLEVLTVRREDQPIPVTAAQLGAALLSEPDLSGILVDPAGPWIRIERTQLEPLIDAARQAEAAGADGSAGAEDVADDA
ncbi:SseB family protein [Microbacterium sp. EYE_5]|uniref:SseB family protein n=1 Tax=unclassified Microbacterium TaxID=2609290 RepID=UPI002002CB09|nr:MULTISPECIES: SseB family protein [unclassified Microbacterium]MCK6081700.1 SseB family protein [Microbacterium sp. EYE_382]MCK6086970.1 SseB family protein [Microbacterium sp. EYE_384]MCK6123532.1 SseB family protein [Microbacterium sp. EYE_80]MCK6126441.1 SseB family protein [Microbacterium sp. EYE_79]MCK6142654.1 SseB family protein [Microbacterium sp. EYE_39]